jgi:predicted nuclease of predicted toxin-antitoxin system
VRLKADENLPQSVVELVRSRGHDVHTVVEEGLGGAKDSVVARAALDEQRVLLTLDQDFADIRAYPPGSHPGIIVIRLDTPKRSLIRAAVSGLLARHDLDGLAGCVAIVQLGAIRIRRPPGDEQISPSRPGH